MDYAGEKEKEKYFFVEKDYLSSNHGFKELPGSPFVYWISDKFKSLFDAPASDEVINLREGIHTGDNERFLRCWFEIDKNDFVTTAKSEEDIDSKGKWVPYNKGGTYRKWYGNNELVIGFNQYYRNEMSKLTGHVRPSQSLYFKSGQEFQRIV